MSIRCISISALLCVPICATVCGQATQPASQATGKLRWARDQRRPVASVDGGELTLADLARHIDERHAPGYMKLLEEPGMLDLESAKAPIWVRAFADVKALEAEAKSRGMTPKEIEPALAASLKSAFEKWLEAYQKTLGANAQLTQENVNQLLAHFQKDTGLETEVHGYLDLLVPDNFTEGQLYKFYMDNALVYGGVMSFAHILVRHRDPVTGELLPPAEQKAAQQRVDDLRTRLLADGSNFEEVAKRYSEDRATSKRGGVFENVTRLDPRLPAALVRAAWVLPEGKWSGPIESPFGLHLVKKIGCEMEKFIIYHEDIKPQIRSTMRKIKQEDLLFALRERRRVKLLY